LSRTRLERRKNKIAGLVLKRLKKTKIELRLTFSSFIDGAGKSNWPWRQYSLKQSVKFPAWKVFGIKGFHFDAEIIGSW